jgi:hypothetical protein
MKNWLGVGWVVVLAGCSSVDDAQAPAGAADGATDVEAANETGGLNKLPEPAIRRAAVRELKPEQLMRAREVEQHIAARYAGYRILDTVETYGGDIIDYIDAGTVPGSDAEPPPSPTAEEMALPPGVQLQRTEVDEHPELRGPAGSIAMVRPRFDTYLSGESGAKSLPEHLRMLSNQSRAVKEANAQSRKQVAGQPAGQFRLYGGYNKFVNHTRLVSYINEFSGSIQASTFSLMEMATVCPGANMATTLELVGATISRDRLNFGYVDSVPRIQVEFATAGTSMGDFVGGWDPNVRGFVPKAGRPYGPGATLTGSTVGGNQFESRFEITLSGGNWWIGHNGNWLGYYPGNLFNLINTKGCQAHWYGEVFDGTPASWTSTNMGSGLFANEGYGRAAYFRQPFYTNTAGVALWLDAPVISAPIDNKCYTTSALKVGAAPWERSFFLGGPGGEAAGCD